MLLDIQQTLAHFLFLLSCSIGLIFVESKLLIWARHASLGRHNINVGPMICRLLIEIDILLHPNCCSWLSRFIKCYSWCHLEIVWLIVLIGFDIFINTYFLLGQVLNGTLCLFNNHFVTCRVIILNSHWCLEWFWRSYSSVSIHIKLWPECTLMSLGLYLRSSCAQLLSWRMWVVGFNLTNALRAHPKYLLYLLINSWFLLWVC